MNEWKARLKEVVDGRFWFLNREIRTASEMALVAIEVLEGQAIEARNSAKRYKDDFISLSNKRFEAEQELIATKQSLVKQKENIKVLDELYQKTVEEKRQLQQDVIANVKRVNLALQEKDEQTQERWKVEELLKQQRRAIGDLAERLYEACEAVLDLQNQRDDYANELMEYLDTIKSFQIDIEELNKKFQGEPQPCE